MVSWDCLRFVIVVFPDHTHLLLLHPIFNCVAVNAVTRLRINGVPFLL